MAPTVSGDFFQMPTLSPLGYQEVVGESNYQDAIAAVFARYDSRYVTAQLVPEPTNQYDRNAIVVTIDGAKVGYIPRDETREYHRVIGDLHRAGHPVAVRAQLTGGEGRKYWGVVLLAEPGLFNQSLGILFGQRSLVLKVDKSRLDEVAGALPVGSQHSATLRVTDDDECDVEVWVGGLLVGTLRKDKADHYVNTIWALEDRSIPASTVLTADTTDGGRPRFSVLLPSDWEEWDEAAYGNFEPRVQAAPAQQVAATPAVPPAWHPDPLGRFQYRWWDGTAWTGHVSHEGQAYFDPLPQ